MNYATVVLLDFPFAEGRGNKVRPGLVIRANDDRDRGSAGIVAMITRRVPDPEIESFCVRISADSLEGRRAGLKADSTIRSDRLASVHPCRIRKVLGSVSGETMDAVNRSLKQALALT